MLKRSVKTSSPTPRLPAGYERIPVRTTYLQMQANPVAEPPAPPAGCTVERWAKPEVHEYRKLFAAVGRAWGWSGRLIMKEEELQAVLNADATEIYRLRCGGETAGFAELDRSAAGQAEIAYFGLLPAFIGRGLGKFLLSWAIHRAWQGKTQRVWLHTCQYDHPQALAVYLKAGFSVYDRQVEMQPYAEEFIRNSLTPCG